MSLAAFHARDLDLDPLVLRNDRVIVFWSNLENSSAQSDAILRDVTLVVCVPNNSWLLPHLKSV